MRFGLRSPIEYHSQRFQMSENSFHRENNFHYENTMKTQNTIVFTMETNGFHCENYVKTSYIYNYLNINRCIC